MALVKQKKIKKQSWSASDISFVAIASAVVFAGSFLLAHTFWKATPNSDPEKLLVRQWLKENLDDGRWEEVKWYPAETFQGLYDSNRLHIIEGIEKAKAAYEKGKGKEEHKAECQKLYDKVCETGHRTFCAMKFRVATMNGESKALRQQVWEIADGKAVALPSNEIREIPFSLSDGSINLNRFAHDGWKMFTEKEYDPFPPELFRNLESRLREVMVWKEPVPTPVERPTPVVQAPPKPVVVALNVPAQKPKEEPKETIPAKIREYFDRAIEVRSDEIEKLEKRLSTFETKRKSAKPNEARTLDERIKQTEDTISELKRTKLTTHVASLPNRPEVGDIGAIQVVEVIEIVERETAIVQWLPNGKGRLPKVLVAVHLIDTDQIKVGDATINADFVKVVATKSEPSDDFEQLFESKSKVEFVVEPFDKKDVDSWGVEYEKENKPRK